MAETVLVTGASGILGRTLVPRLATAGWDVRAAGRRGPVRLDIATGEGLKEAVRGASVIIHTASNPIADGQQTDVEGTRALLREAKAAGIRHILYPGIVGVDRAQASPFYRIKLAGEQAVKTAGVPWTILRATQFFELIPDRLLPPLLHARVQFVYRKYRLQPIEVDEVAEELVRLASGEPLEMTLEFGGPEALTMEGMARSWSAAAGVRRPILAVPLLGAFGRQVRAGALLPERARGKVTWAEWLRRRYPRVG